MIINGVSYSSVINNFIHSARKIDYKYDVYAWGYESNGNMSGTSYSGLHSEPIKLPFKADDILEGYINTLIYRQGNNIYALGGTHKGSLGLGENYSQYNNYFTPIKCYSGTNIQKIEFNDCCIILDNGTLYGSSNSEIGCFNDGLEQKHYNWDVIDTNVEDFSLGEDFICYKKDNKLYHCGRDVSFTNIIKTYTSQIILEDASDVITVIGRWGYIIALTSDLKNAYV